MADEGKTPEQLWTEIQAEREGTPPAQDASEPPEIPPESEAAPEEAPAVESKEAEKVYAELSPEIQAKLQQFDQMAATLPQLVNELREAKGRIGSLQSQWQKAQQTAASKPSEAQIAAAAKDSEKWSTIKKEYPDWGEAIEAFVDTRLSGLPKTGGVSNEQIEQLIAQRTGEATATVVKELNEKLVSVKHPNWKADIVTPQFVAWFQTQGPEVQQLAASPDGTDAIRMLDMFAEAKKKPVAEVQQDRQQRLAAAATRPNRASSVPATKSIDDMSREELWEHEARLRAKRAA